MSAEIPAELCARSPEGVPIRGLIELRDNKGSVARIEPLGAIFSLSLGGEPVLRVLTALNTARVGGKRAVTHPCSPNFGSVSKKDYGLPKHGTARLTEWELFYHDVVEGGAEIGLRCDIKGGTYPSGLVVEQVFGLKNGVFQLVTCHSNTGEAPLPVNFAEHLYFWTGYVGWDGDGNRGGLSINGEEVGAKVRETGVITLRDDTNLIDFPRCERLLEMRQIGLPKAVLWAGSVPIPDALMGTPSELETHYVCIEPTEGLSFGDSESMIQPWDSRTTQIALTLHDRR